MVGRFFLSKNEFAEYAKDKKSLLMENFYHFMRKKLNILMVNNKPLGGKWNYDKDNRKPIKHNFTAPTRFKQRTDFPAKEARTTRNHHALSFQIGWHANDAPYGRQ